MGSTQKHILALLITAITTATDTTTNTTTFTLANIVTNTSNTTTKRTHHIPKHIDTILMHFNIVIIRVICAIVIVSCNGFGGMDMTALCVGVVGNGYERAECRRRGERIWTGSMQVPSGWILCESLSAQWTMDKILVSL